MVLTLGYLRERERERGGGGNFFYHLLSHIVH